MFSKLLKPLTIFCLIAMVCVLGYTVFVNAQGRGYECRGNTPTSNWSDGINCNGRTRANCHGNVTLVASSDKECVETGNQSHYCRISPLSLRDGTGVCSWNGSSCRNPPIDNRVNVDNC